MDWASTLTGGFTSLYVSKSTPCNSDNRTRFVPTWDEWGQNLRGRLSPIGGDSFARFLSWFDLSQHPGAACAPRAYSFPQSFGAQIRWHPSQFLLVPECIGNLFFKQKKQPHTRSPHLGACPLRFGRDNCARKALWWDVGLLDTTPPSQIRYLLLGPSSTWSQLLTGVGENWVTWYTQRRRWWVNTAEEWCSLNSFESTILVLSLTGILHMFIKFDDGTTAKPFLFTGVLLP